MIIIVGNYHVSHDAGREKTEWQATWRITASVLTPDKVGQGKVKKVNSDLGQDEK